MAKKVKKADKSTTKKVVKKASNKDDASKQAVKANKTTPKSVKSAKKNTNSTASQAEPKTRQNSSSSIRAVQGSTKTYLTPEELEHFRSMLMDKLRQLTGDVNSIENEALGKNRADATGNLSSMPIHMADIGSDTFEQDFALGLMSSEKKIVTEIIAALKRIEDGTYGICEGTGRPIPKARLEANPWARYCVEYATKLEKGLVTFKQEPRRWTKRDEDAENEEDEKEEADEEQEEVELEEEAEEFDVLEEDPDLEDLYEIDESEGSDIKEQP